MMKFDQVVDYLLLVNATALRGIAAGEFREREVLG